jgi:hypothetical protein
MCNSKSPLSKKHLQPTKQLQVNYDSPFSLKVIKIESPVNTGGNFDSPHFAHIDQQSESPSSDNKHCKLFYLRLKELIVQDKHLICMKNILSNRNSSIKTKQQ